MLIPSCLSFSPRPMFWCQIIATVIAGTVQLGVQAWMFTNVDGMCDADQPDGFICPSTTVFGTASIIWGVIGPARQFSQGQMYYGLCFFFLAGALAPAITRLVQFKFNYSWIRYINWPLIFSATGLIPPATPSNYVIWCVVGFIFNYVIRRRHFSWWTKYNCESLSLLYPFEVLTVLFLRRSFRCSRRWKRALLYLCLLCPPVS
jgi:OPT family oligopeptide transporter